MKFNISRQWCAEKAEQEAGANIGAGILGIDPWASDDEARVTYIDDSRIAFGRFVHLHRRHLKMSYEDMAEFADIEIAELMNIEHDASFEPEPRTVYQLASVFKVDPKKLMELSGLMQAKNAPYIEDTVRYAARSEALHTLSEIEKHALDAMVSALSEKHA